MRWARLEGALELWKSSLRTPPLPVSAGAADASVDGSSSPCPAKRAKAFPSKPVAAGPPPPASGSRAATAAPPNRGAPPASSRAGSARPRSTQCCVHVVIGVWIGGFPSDQTRSVVVRWAAAAVKSRIGQEVGEEGIKSRSIGHNCMVVLGTVDDAIVVSQCFQDDPPRWADARAVTHVLRARQDRSGTQIGAD